MKIEIKPGGDPFTYQILVDGVDLSKRCVGVGIQMAVREFPVVTLTYIPDSIEVELDSAFVTIEDGKYSIPVRGPVTGAGQ